MSYIKDRINRLKKALTQNYTKEDCNVILQDTSDVTEILDKSIGKKPYRIATSGYSFPQPEYEKTTFKFLKELDKQLGSDKTGYVTTPALSDGSIYDITTRVGGLKPENMVLFTTKRYWEGTELDTFRKDVNMRKYTKAPIYAFPDTKTYADATANASNVLVCTGGRKVAVTEIVEALKRKSKVVLLINENLQNEGFNWQKGNVDSAAKYFLDYMIKCQKDLPQTQELDLDFLKTHPGRITQLLRVYFVTDNDESIKSAAIRSSGFLKGKTAYDFWPSKADEIDKEPGAVQRQVDQKAAIEHMLKTGERKFLYS